MVACMEFEQRVLACDRYGHRRWNAEAMGAWRHWVCSSWIGNRAVMLLAVRLNSVPSAHCGEERLEVFAFPSTSNVVDKVRRWLDSDTIVGPVVKEEIFYDSSFVASHADAACSFEAGS
jgi:hypothetical protein